MKRYIQRTVAVLATLIVLLIGWLIASEFLRAKQSDIKYRDFYSNQEEYDVLLCGSSHMMNTIYPMEMWKHYGIRAYNIANSTEAVPTSYWVLKSALEYKKPKVVVLEVFLAGNNKISPNNEAFLHNYFDALPLSCTKIKAMQDLLPKERVLEYLVDFSIYHSRWEELEEMDFNPGRNLNKGAGGMVGWYDAPQMEYTHEIGAVGDCSLEYIKKIKAMCDENDISLIIMLSPYVATCDEQKNHNAMKVLADELQVDFLNLIDQNVVDYSIDMFDRGHCNLAGGILVTDYLGDYLATHYGARFETADKAVAAAWDKNYEEYTDDLEKKLGDEQNLFNVLILLQQDTQRYKIKIKKDAVLLQDEVFCKFLERLDSGCIIYSDKMDADIIFDIFVDEKEDAIHKEFDSKKVLVGNYKQP